MIHLFRSSIQAACGRLVAPRSGSGVRLACAVKIFGLSSVLRLSRVDQSSLRSQQLGLTPRADLCQIQNHTHEILAILSYWEGIDLSGGEMAEVRYDVAMSLSKGCGGAAGR